MKKKMYIPNDVVIGFQERDDTMTGKLAYITYKKNNKPYKETSWMNWCNNNIDKINTENEPTSGFLVSKDITRVSYSYYSRGNYTTKMRIYDPRGFDFEISIHNLQVIIQHCNLNNGEIEGEFVYAWDGAELILLPTKTIEYKESLSFSENENKKIYARDLVVGRTYQTKKTEDLTVYLGRYDFHAALDYNRRKDIKQKILDKHNVKGNKMISFVYTPYKEAEKKHVFYNVTKDCYEVNSQNKLSICLDEDLHEEYDNMLESFINSPFGTKISNFKISEERIDDFLVKNGSETFFKKIGENKYLKYKINESFSNNSDSEKYYINNISVVFYDEETQTLIKDFEFIKYTNFYACNDYKNVALTYYKLINKDHERFINAALNNDVFFFKKHNSNINISIIEKLILLNDCLTLKNKFIKKTQSEDHSLYLNKDEVELLLLETKSGIPLFQLENGENFCPSK